ncbi:MAG: 3-dehydroquinate synthase [Pseudomonadota bacterium]
MPNKPWHASQNMPVPVANQPPVLTASPASYQAADLAAPAPDMATGVTSLDVALGARSYPIIIGPKVLEGAGPRLAARFPTQRFAPIVDATLTDNHWPVLATSFAAAGCTVAEPIFIPSGEASKSWDGLKLAVEGLLDRGVDRRSVVVAMGGGVIGDLAGFAAASVMRGVDFVQIPTTLLAQVDSSVGGKTGINAKQGKNLVGAFHQPRDVLIDIDTLSSLPDREMRAGYAEIVKYGLLGDRGFFEWLETNGRAVLAREPAALTQAIKQSCAAKAAIVAADEREAGARALLNLGHTFAHALEAEAGYDGSLLHGEAVSIGLSLAFRLSVALGHCDGDPVVVVDDHLTSLGMPVLPHQGAWRQSLSADRLLRHMAIDKKAVDGALTFILARDIGDAFVAHEVAAEAVRPVLDEFLSRVALAS